MIVSKSDSFKMKIECINAERDVITHLPNPNIEKLKRAQPRLRKIRFSEEETKDKLLPVHILLGVKDYIRIRLSEASIIGEKPDFPVAEQTKVGFSLAVKQHRLAMSFVISRCLECISLNICATQMSLVSRTGQKRICSIMIYIQRTNQT